MRKRVTIGIPCFNSVSPETLEDYMRFAYYLGRHYEGFDFSLAIKPKSEQFRARNSIVEAALQWGADYVLMLDDDHVIDWMEQAQTVANAEQSHYEFLRTLIGHMERTPGAAIVGALYYHRGGECRPVVMKEGKDGGFYYMRDDEIANGLQEVAVTGGGCMLIDMNLFSRIPGPWFEPEFQFGTDVQICKKAREEGRGVYCDTSLTLGHVLSRREVVTAKNRHRIMAESQARGAPQGIDPEWSSGAALRLYHMDVEQYLGMDLSQIQEVARRYSTDDLSKYQDDLTQYYATRGKAQLARQVLFHLNPHCIEEMEFVFSTVNTNAEGYGIEFGCGSAPVSFELALRGHRMDFVDIDGAAAYEFTKWRAKHRGIEDRCGWSIRGPYDYALMLDAIEHIKDWEPVLEKIVDALKNDGALITNYFRNQDYDNPEHVSMDKGAVKQFLVSRGVYPLNEMVWIKRDLGWMDKKVA